MIISLMPDYSNGKIYKLVSDKTDMIYIGSTTKKLYRRLSNHKKGGCNSKILFKLGGNIYIELIKLFPCDGKKELEKEEGEYIKKYKNICVNKCIPGRTRKEKYKCVCGSEICRKHKLRHERSNKHISFINNNK